jgi:hypothetical protein
MKRMIALLTAALVLQLGVALLLGFSGQDHGTFKGGRLLDVAADRIDHLKIDGGDEGSVRLVKVDGTWTLPGDLDAKADAGKVKTLLSTLLAIERPWPVAETDDAQSRFKVADRDYERRVVFGSGDDTVATLLLGTSPGFRKVHARLAGEQKIYDIPFATYQASLKAADWLDRTPVFLEPKQIEAVDLPDCRLVRGDEGFKLADLGAGERTDRETARKLVDRLAHLRIEDVYARADRTLPKPAVLSIKIELKDGNTRRYDFAPGPEDGETLLKVTAAPHLYRIAPALLEDLEAFSRPALVKDASATPPGSAGKGKVEATAPAPG